MANLALLTSSRDAFAGGAILDSISLNIPNDLSFYSHLFLNLFPGLKWLTLTLPPLVDVTRSNITAEIILGAL